MHVDHADFGRTGELVAVELDVTARGAVVADERNGFGNVDSPTGVELQENGAPRRGDGKQTLRHFDSTNGLGIQEHGELAEHPTGQSGKWGAVFNFVNTIVGAGIIGLPFALYQCGLWSGLLLIALAAFLVDRSAIMLVEAGQRTNRMNYEEMMGLMFGAAGVHSFCFFAFVMAFGAMSAYLIIIGDTIPEIASAAGHDGFFTDRHAVIALFSIFIILPIASLKDMHKLAYTSFLSVSADAILILIVLATGPEESKSNDDIDRAETLVFIRPTVFAGFGAISFAFVCQSSSFLVYRSLKRPGLDAWVSITNTSLAIAWGMATVLAMIGFLSFVDQTEGDILNNFSTTHAAANAARGFLAVTMVFTFPMVRTDSEKL